MFKIPSDSLESIALEHNLSQPELETLNLALSGQSASQIAAHLSISAVAVRKRLGSVYQKFNLPGNTPGKLETLKSVLREKYQESFQGDRLQSHQDWGEAVDISTFYGRERELNTLEKWTIAKRCRLIAILGMGGVGKTALAIKFAEKIEQEFDYVVWRSLRSAPMISEVLADLYKFFSNQQKTNLPINVDQGTNILINEYLQKFRCLIVLDNFESILETNTRAGFYRHKYEDYGRFLSLVGEMSHSSCIILTSRENPKEIAVLEGKNQPIKVLRLTGLQEAGKNICEAEGLLGSKDELLDLVMRYAGNPLALRIAATTIKNLFAGNIKQFLEQEIGTFGDIRDLLQEQFERLSDLEIEIMYWLALEREPVSIFQLKENLVIPPLGFQLLEAIESLARRSLIEVEISGAYFTLQNVVIEYLYDRLIEEVCQEIVVSKIDLLNNYALLKATAKEYVREAQARLILESIKNRLLALFGDRSRIELQLKAILTTSRQESILKPGYTAGNILNLLCQLESNLEKYDFSHLTVRQAYLQNVNLRDVNFAGAHFSQCVFTKIFGGILSVTYSPDGNYLATGDTNGEILFWQINSSQRLLRRPHSRINKTTEPSYEVCSTGGIPATQLRAALTVGQLQSRLKADNNFIRVLAYSPDGQCIASIGENQTIKIWSALDNSCIKIIEDSGNQVWSIVFSPEGHFLASAGEDCTIKIWSVATGQPCKILKGHSDCIRSIAYSPEGHFLASAGEDCTIKIWSVATGLCLQTLEGHSNWIRSVAYSPEGQFLASGSEDNTIKIWSVATGKCLQTLEGHSNWVWSIAYSPDSQFLASGSADRTVKVWSIATGECFHTFEGHSNWVQSVAYSPDGQLLASGSTDRTIKIWNSLTRKCQQTLQGHSIWMRSMSYSPDGQFLVSGGEDRTVKIWSVATGECLQTFEGHSNWVWSVAYSPDGQLIASSSPDRTIKIWSVTGDLHREIREKEGNWSRTLIFSPEGEFIISGNEDTTIKIWSLSTGECLQTLKGHDDWVGSVVYSPDGQFLASGSTDRTIKIWSLSTGECLQTLKGHDDWVSSVAYSPDGQFLASGSTDKTIKIWSLSTGQCFYTLFKSEGWISSVKYSPNGDFLASTGFDETIKIWDLKTKECFQKLQQPRPYEGMNISGVNSLSKTQISTLLTLGAKIE